MTVNYNDIGKRIRQIRRNKGITQEVLAEGVGVGATHISRIENGKTKPSLETIMNIVEYLEITPDKLLCGSVNTAKVTLIKEVADIFEDCTTEEVVKYTHILSEMKRYDRKCE